MEKFGVFKLFPFSSPIPRPSELKANHLKVLVLKGKKKNHVPGGTQDLIIVLAVKLCIHSDCLHNKSLLKSTFMIHSFDFEDEVKI